MGSQWSNNNSAGISLDVWLLCDQTGEFTVCICVCVGGGGGTRYLQLLTFYVSQIVVAGQKIPPLYPVKRSGCHCPDGISPCGALNRTFIELIIE